MINSNINQEIVFIFEWINVYSFAKFCLLFNNWKVKRFGGKRRIFRDVWLSELFRILINVILSALKTTKITQKRAPHTKSKSNRNNTKNKFPHEDNEKLSISNTQIAAHFAQSQSQITLTLVHSYEIIDFPISERK